MLRGKCTEVYFFVDIKVFQFFFFIYLFFWQGWFRDMLGFRGGWVGVGWDGWVVEGDCAVERNNNSPTLYWTNSVFSFFFPPLNFQWRGTEIDVSSPRIWMKEDYITCRETKTIELWWRCVNYHKRNIWRNKNNYINENEIKKNCGNQWRQGLK